MLENELEQIVDTLNKLAAQLYHLYDENVDAVYHYPRLSDLVGVEINIRNQVIKLNKVLEAFNGKTRNSQGKKV